MGTIDAVIIASDQTFRIVRATEGSKVTYVVELPDGADSLGVERWKEVSADGKVVKAMRDFIIRAAVKEQHSEPKQS